MRKSNHRQHKYRAGTSTGQKSPTTFREQMADYAKGEVLRELRKKTGLSREKVAAEVGVTTKTLYSWEMLDGGIKVENARRLADFYGVVDAGTLIASSEEGGDQLDRIEQKLDAILQHLGISSDPAAQFEAELAEAAAEAGQRAPGRGSGTAGAERARPRAAH